MALILDGTSGLSDVDGSAATPAIRGTDTNTGMFFPAADTIAFAEGGVESMRLDSNGNVGIGTNNPSGFSSKFVVAGSSGAIKQSIVNTSATSGDSSQLSIGSGSYAVDYYTFTSGYTAVVSTGTQFNIGTFGANPVIIQTNAAERMRVTSTGNVSIGTSAEPAKFTVAAAISQASIITFAGNSNAVYPSDTFGGSIGYNFTAGGGEVDFWNNWTGASSTQGGFAFRKQTGASSNNMLMLIRGDGNVGIGTASPNSTSGFTTLTLNNASNGGIIDMLSNGTTVGRIFNNSTSFHVYNQTANPLLFGTSGTERMRIDSSGNVQLSTANTSILNSSGRRILNQTGSILQVVQTVKTDTFSTSSTSLVQITGLTVSITPSSASNRILVLFNGMASANNGENISLQLQRNTTPIFIGDASGSRLQCFYGANSYNGAGGFPMSAMFLDSPATTSSITYSVYMRTSAATVFLNRTVTDEDSVNRGRTASSIIVMEVAA